MKMSTKKITLTGLFIAINIIFTQFVTIETGVPLTRVSLGSAALALTGIMLGPIYGAIAAALADTIGFFMTNAGGYPYFAGYALSYALAAAIHGLFLHKRYSLKKLIISMAITSMVIDFGMHLLWVPLYWPNPAIWKTILYPQLIKSILLYPVLVTLVHFVYKGIQKAK